MDLTSKKNIQILLKKYQTRPLKKLGQNFLIDKRVVKKMIEAAQLKPKEVVLEIGPGIGTLTMKLSKSVKKVIAVEKDPKMIEILKETLKDFSNIKIICDDILKIENWKSEIGNSFKIVASLPFYLTTPAIRKFLENVEIKPQQITLIVQKEVGQRICAYPPKMSILAVSVQFYATCKIVSYVSKKSFWPSPEVDSVILQITSLINTERKLINSDLFFRIVKAGFLHPRKQLINNLSQGLNISRDKIKNWLSENNIKYEQRAETLSIENWITLTKSFSFVVK